MEEQWVINVISDRLAALATSAATVFYGIPFLNKKLGEPLQSIDGTLGDIVSYGAYGGAAVVGGYLTYKLAKMALNFSLLKPFSYFTNSFTTLGLSAILALGPGDCESVSDRYEGIEARVTPENVFGLNESRSSRGRATDSEQDYRLPITGNDDVDSLIQRINNDRSLSERKRRERIEILGTLSNVRALEYVRGTSDNPSRNNEEGYEGIDVDYVNYAVNTRFELPEVNMSEFDNLFRQYERNGRARYEPGSREFVELFRDALRVSNLPEEWAENPSLQYIINHESMGGTVGIPNYKICSVDTREPMARSNRSQWRRMHSIMRDGTSAFRNEIRNRNSVVYNGIDRNGDGNYENNSGRYSSAVGLGQLTLGGYESYSPNGLNAVGNPFGEAVAAVRYSRARYGNPDNAVIFKVIRNWW